MFSFSMFNEVLTHVGFTSLMVLSLLSVRRYVIAQFGVNIMYFMWGLLPLSLVSLLLPAPWNEVDVTQTVESIVVSASTTVRQYSESNWWQEIWFVGMVAGLMVALLRHFHSLRHFEMVPVNKTKIAALRSSPRMLAVFYSKNVESPMLVGVIQPKLVLPVDFQHTLSPLQQQLVIEHELCHLKRHDNVCNMIGFFLVLCFWFNPLVWLAYHCFRRDQELACDAMVLANKSAFMRLEYSKALLAVAIKEQRMTVGTLAFRHQSTQHQVVERVTLLKKLKEPTHLTLLLVSVFTIAFLLSVNIMGNVYSEHRMERGFKPHIVSRETPKYPYGAAKKQIEGYVKMAYDVNKDGYVDNIKVIEAYPANTFENNAIKALAQWRYESTGFNVSSVQLQMDFKMD